jgi:hypothetical protein
MDPNTALENILSGHEVHDHVMALGQWLARQGFAPHEQTVPEACAAFVAEHCAKHYPHFARTDIRVRADKTGLWTAPPDGHWISLALWIDLLRVDADEESST